MGIRTLKNESLFTAVRKGLTSPARIELLDEIEKRFNELEKQPPVPEPLKLPEMCPDLVDILGRPNFQCSHTATLLRSAGSDIPFKSEHEQAHTLHWMLGAYLKDPASWRQIIDGEYKEMHAKYAASKAGE